MPYYDYHCENCGTIQTVKRTIKEIEENTPVPCNYCDSTNTKRYYKPVAITTTSHSNSYTENVQCCHHCNCYEE